MRDDQLREKIRDQETILAGIEDEIEDLDNRISKTAMIREDREYITLRRLRLHVYERETENTISALEALR